MTLSQQHLKDESFEKYAARQLRERSRRPLNCEEEEGQVRELEISRNASVLSNNRLAGRLPPRFGEKINTLEEK